MFIYVHYRILTLYIVLLLSNMNCLLFYIFCYVTFEIKDKIFVRLLRFI